eukprot:Nitzschia sp. Nitz4//scaffold60_size111251//10210//11139//NITZ4_004136-RA/size111251-processed-gene-0.16-mRNA-1//1//CDS//3329555531//3356//frame0
MQRSEALCSPAMIVNHTRHENIGYSPDTRMTHQRVGLPRTVSPRSSDIMEEDIEKRMLVPVLSPSPSWNQQVEQSPRHPRPLHAEEDGFFLRDDRADVFADAPLTKFPWRLHEMLEDAERCGFSKIVSWLPGNKSFRVHQQSRFEQLIMPKYFRQTKFKSFRRQINMWSFQRIKLGEGRGGYFHESFVRGKPDLCLAMKRTKLKGINRVVGTKNTTSPTIFHNQRSTPNSEHFEVRNKQPQDCHDLFMCYTLCPREDKRFSWLRDHEACLWNDAYKAAELSLKLPSPVYSSDEIQEEVISIFGGNIMQL